MSRETTPQKQQGTKQPPPPHALTGLGWLSVSFTPNGVSQMHTPGPWTAYNAHGSTTLRSWRIEERNTTPGIGRPVATVANEDQGRSGDEQVANARLIAASPALLKALTELVNFAAPHSPGSKYIASARAAIAQATT